MEPHPAGPRRGRGPIAILTAIACVSLVVLYGIERGGRKETTDASACPTSVSLVKTLAPLVRGDVAALDLLASPRPLPDLSFQDPAGKPLQLSDFKGKAVLLNLWATWCIPCRQEMPALDKLQARIGGPDFEVVAVNVDTTRLDRRESFLKEAGVRALKFYADPSAQILRRLKEAGPVVGLPTSFLLDQHGCELGVMSGPADWASGDVAALVNAAVGGSAPAKL